MDSKDVFFQLVDQEIATCTTELRNRILSDFRELPWSSSHREQLPPLIRQELNSLFQAILGLFDNIGCTLPDDLLGWKICDARDNQDIRVNNLDYADIWDDLLASRER